MMKCSYLRYQWPEIAAARGSDSGRERLNGGGDGGDAPLRAARQRAAAVRARAALGRIGESRVVCFGKKSWIIF
jgi:hypothetical protein